MCIWSPSAALVLGSSCLVRYERHGAWLYPSSHLLEDLFLLSFESHEQSPHKHVCAGFPWMWGFSDSLGHSKKCGFWVILERLCLILRETVFQNVPTILQPTTCESDFQLLHCISSICSCRCSEPEPFYQPWSGISFNIPVPRDIDGQPLTICSSPLVKYLFGSEYILSCLPVTVDFFRVPGVLQLQFYQVCLL